MSSQIAAGTKRSYVADIKRFRVLSVFCFTALHWDGRPIDAQMGLIPPYLSFTY